MYAASAEGRHKVYIVDEAHMLTREAWNAAPQDSRGATPRVVFVFATTEPQKIAQSAPRILSRLQRFDFRRLVPCDRRSPPARGHRGGARRGRRALHLIAKSADGGMPNGFDLDQVLSFGEGPVTARRVREVLGLISDDVMASCCDSWAERDIEGRVSARPSGCGRGRDREFVAGRARSCAPCCSVNSAGNQRGSRRRRSG